MKNHVPVLLFILLSCSKHHDTPAPPVTPAPAPVLISGIMPDSGAKGTQIVITGSNFSATPTNDTVLFNGVPATVVKATSTQLTVILAPSTGTGPVFLKVGDSTALGPVLTYQYTFAVSTLAGSGSSAHIDGTGTGASFQGPKGIAVDTAGNVYVTDNYAEANQQNATYCIRQITPSGVVTTFAGGGPENILTGSPATGIYFDILCGVAVDQHGNVFVPEPYRGDVREITSGSQVSIIAGAFGLEGSQDGVSAAFGLAVGVATDTFGYVYIADSANQNIRKISAGFGAETITLAGAVGVKGSNDGLGAAAHFNTPLNLAADYQSNLYVSDAGNCLIRKISPYGIVTTLAGTAGVAGYADGTGNSATFSHPRGIAVDFRGYIYVAEQETDIIRMITPAGKVTTIVGKPNVTGSANGSPQNATFNTPIGIAVDLKGNLYIVDQGNYLIRKITVD
jgi:hypothetical protein